MSSGNLQGSRWGLKVTEDLDGGLKAIFVLGNGFNVFNGGLAQGSAEFGPSVRRSVDGTIRHGHAGSPV